MSDKCGRCHQSIFFPSKKCHCEEFTIIDEYGEEHSLWANGYEHAALRYAEKYNDEGALINEELNISIRDKETWEVKEYYVGAEPSVRYYSGERETKESKDEDK